MHRRRTFVPPKQTSQKGNTKYRHRILNRKFLNKQRKIMQTQEENQRKSKTIIWKHIKKLRESNKTANCLVLFSPVVCRKVVLTERRRRKGGCKKEQWWENGEEGRRAGEEDGEEGEEGNGATPTSSDALCCWHLADKTICPSLSPEFVTCAFRASQLTRAFLLCYTLRVCPVPTKKSLLVHIVALHT